MSDTWDWERVVDPPAPKRSGRLKVRLLEKGDQMSEELKLWVLRRPDGRVHNARMKRTSLTATYYTMFDASGNRLHAFFCRLGWTLKRETWVKKEQPDE